MKKKQHHNCTIMRRVLVKSYKFNMASGEKSDHKEEWKDKTCGTPLFSYDDRDKGICRSCQQGWYAETNYSIDDRVKNVKTS